MFMHIAYYYCIKAEQAEKARDLRAYKIAMFNCMLHQDIPILGWVQ